MKSHLSYSDPEPFSYPAQDRARAQNTACILLILLNTREPGKIHESTRIPGKLGSPGIELKKPAIRRMTGFKVPFIRLLQVEKVPPTSPGSVSVPPHCSDTE